MRLRRAAVALAILGGALPASGRDVYRQLACVDNEAELSNRDKFYPFYRSVLAVKNAASTCCGCRGMKYFAIGESHKGAGHHTGFVCAHTVAEILGDGYEHKVDDSNCDVACPGLQKDYNAEKSGMCGGGCKGCDAFPNGDKCAGDPDAECGKYRSVYSCDEKETKLPPAGSARPSRGGPVAQRWSPPRRTLPAFSGRPVACVLNEVAFDHRQQYTLYDMSVTRAHQVCCKHPWSYFAVGGFKPEHKVWGRHNRVVCFGSLGEIVGHRRQHQARHKMCDVGCPGRERSHDATRHGLCGGGCKGCPKAQAECVTEDKEAQCGAYRSVYACAGVDQTPLEDKDYVYYDEQAAWDDWYGYNNVTRPKEQLPETSDDIANGISGGTSEAASSAGLQRKELPSSTAQMLRAGTEQTAPEAAPKTEAPKAKVPNALSSLEKLLLLLRRGSTQTE